MIVKLWLTIHARGLRDDPMVGSVRGQPGSWLQGEPPTDWVLAALGLAASSGEPPGSHG
jgi:hypothetical protein